MGGFGGKVVTGKPILATITITHTETLPDNKISNITHRHVRTGCGRQHSIRDVKFSAIGPWAASGRRSEFAYIRNVARMAYSTLSM